MRTDIKIKQDVLDELAWQPKTDETSIGVIVNDGIVTLTGTVDSYSKKIAAERAAKGGIWRKSCCRRYTSEI